MIIISITNIFCFLSNYIHNKDNETINLPTTTKNPFVASTETGINNDEHYSQSLNDEHYSQTLNDEDWDSFYSQHKAKQVVVQKCDDLFSSDDEGSTNEVNNHDLGKETN